MNNIIDYMDETGVLITANVVTAGINKTVLYKYLKDNNYEKIDDICDELTALMGGNLSSTPVFYRDNMIIVRRTFLKNLFCSYFCVSFSSFMIKILYNKEETNVWMVLHLFLLLVR